MPPWRQPPPSRPPLIASDGEYSAGDFSADECTDGEGCSDDLSFLLLPPTGDLVDFSRAYSKWFEPKAGRRLKRFEKRRRSLSVPGQWVAVANSPLKALCRKGLPPEHRAEVWWSVLGCENRMHTSLKSYKDYLDTDLAQKTSEEIERDLHRTFPRHPMFREESGRNWLRNVLHAYACFSPRVQYCQGLNFITGLLLIIFKCEERAFWALACAIDRMGVENYYTEGMVLLRADMRALSGVLTQKCSKVASHLKGLNIDLTPFCSEWFLTWFAKSLPTTTTLRVWDTLFLEGWKILFRVTLGIFKMAEQEVLQCATFEDIMQHAKMWPRRMVEHNELLKASFGSFPALRRRDVRMLRDKAIMEVEQEDEERRRIVRDLEARAALRLAASSSTPPSVLSTAPPRSVKEGNPSEATRS